MENKPVEKTTQAINPAMRHFFFFSLKQNKNFKASEKELGKIKTVSIIITEAKTYMQAEGENDTKDTIFTPEEKKQLLKTFNVKPEVVEACKSIFVMLDMTKKVIHIKQNKKDGTTKEITI